MFKIIKIEKYVLFKIFNKTNIIKITVYIRESISMITQLSVILCGENYGKVAYIKKKVIKYVYFNAICKLIS